MKVDFARVSMTMLAIVVLSLFSVQTVFSSDMVRVIGSVNSELQFVAEDGKIYEIDESDKAEALINLVGSVVEVEGTVENQDDVLVLKVVNFTVLKKAA